MLRLLVGRGTNQLPILDRLPLPLQLTQLLEQQLSFFVKMQILFLLVCLHRLDQTLLAHDFRRQLGNRSRDGRKGF